MGDKKKSIIRKIMLNTPPFRNTVIEPTYINYFYGKNASGKSTIANAIHTGDNVILEGLDRSECDVFLYNQEFVNANIKDNAELPGVFTLNEENIKIQNKVLENNKEIRKLFAAKVAFERENDNYREKLADIHNHFLNTYNYQVAPLVHYFPELFNEFPSEVEQLLQMLCIAEPVEQQMDDLKIYYSVVYEDGLPVSSSLSEFPDLSCSDEIKELFIPQKKKRNNRNRSSIPDQTPPLPSNRRLSTIKSQLLKYREDIQSIDSHNSSVNVPAFILEETNYELYYSIMLHQVELAIALTEYAILHKEVDDQQTIDRINTVGIDIKYHASYMNEIIVVINSKLSKIENLSQNESQARDDCATHFAEHIRFLMDEVIQRCDEQIKEINSSLEYNLSGITSLQEKVSEISAQSQILLAGIIQTDEVMNSINRLLRESGFESFRLNRTRVSLEKDFDIDGHIYMDSYEIDRMDGTHAHSLSEAERNLIAFLYFYFTIRGTTDKSAENKKKIIVIDDPMSSLDSNSMFLVSTIIREMVDSCYTNITLEEEQFPYLIKQIFIFTHNTYFHHQLTYDQLGSEKYEAVTIFLIDKTHNDSTVKPCTKKDPSSNTPAYEINYNPVKNSYAALWQEYVEVQSSPALMNVIRHILEYYFLQICGYSGQELSKKILDSVKEESGHNNSDSTDCLIASSMIKYLTASSFGVPDDQHFSDNSWDIERCRKIFESIFTLTNQHQHYEMMIRNSI